MKPAAIALLITALTAMPAVARVVMFDDIFDLGELRDHGPQPDPARIDEVLPAKHHCSEVPVLIRAQQRTVERMTQSCAALKWAEDRFHALFQTVPGNIVTYENPVAAAHHQDVTMHMFVFNTQKEQEKYMKEFWGLNIRGGGLYFGGIAVLTEYSYGSTLSTEVHEYAHHLDRMYIHRARSSFFYPLWVEGLASFIQGEYGRFRSGRDWYNYNTGPVHVIRDGLRHGLPRLTAFLDRDGDAWSDLVDKLGLGYIRYNWGALAFRFFDDRHHDALLDIKAIFASTPPVLDSTPWRDFEWYDEHVARILAVVAPLDEDWLEWLREFVTLSPYTPEPVVLVVGDEHYQTLQHFRSDDGIPLRLGATAWIYLGEFFRTVRNLAFDLSSLRRLDGGSMSMEPEIQIYAGDKQMRILAGNPGTWEFTIIATTQDGESAELLFTVTVVERLVSREFIIHDPLSLEEGRTVVNLRQYFGGPEHIAFTAESANVGIATVAVTEGGRLVLTAVSPGAAEITVRAAALGQDAQQTFTIVVNDDCPPWLCSKGIFSGWRKSLLETSQ